MIDHKFFAPVRAVSERTLRRRRRSAATSTSRRTVSAVTVATLFAGGVALAQQDESRAVSARMIASASAAAPAADPAPDATVAAADTSSTSAEAAPEPEAAPAPPPPAEPEQGPAYRVVAADGGVFTHGWYGYSGSASGLTKSPITGVAQTSDGEGYWLSSVDGGVFAFGTAPFFGSAVGLANQPLVDIAAAPSGKGYYVVSRNGGVFAFGEIGFFGAAADLSLASPITAMAATPSGNGYWLVARDGGVFAYGDAAFYGGVVGQQLNAAITDIVPTPTGQGYYLASSDGGVFAFGDAPFFGAAADQKLYKPIVDMAVAPDGKGYWLVASDGGVFAYGAAPFLGTPPSHALSGPVVGIAGGVGTHKPGEGDAYAAIPAPPAPATPVVAAAAAPARASNGKGKDKDKNNPKAVEPADGKFGWDISYPQCGGPYPGGEYAYAIIGINGGRAFKKNPCLADEWRWASQTAAAGVYVNVNFPRSEFELGMGAASARQPNCNGEIGCVAYNFGWNGIVDALGYAVSQGVDAPFVWLDVEQLNYWTPNHGLNATVLRGAIDSVREHGKGVGIYSTPFQYNKIMGGEIAGVPVWTAGSRGFENVGRYCAERGFGGGPVALVQLLPGQFDPNVACPGAGPMSMYFKVRD